MDPRFVSASDQRPVSPHRRLQFADSASFAIPKSSTFTYPSGQNVMFSGLISRWTIAGVMGGGECARHLDRNVNSFTQLDALAVRPFTQCFAVDQVAGYVMS